MPNEGRVEVFYDGEWGTVCNNSFDDTDADVVCRELGYPGTIAGYSCCATYGEGSGPIWLDDVACNGTEASLYNCSHNGFGVHNCIHDKDIGVICETQGMLALVYPAHVLITFQLIQCTKTFLAQRVL